MEIMKFKVKNLKDFDVYKEKGTLKIKLMYNEMCNNKIEFLEKVVEGKIHHWSYYQVCGWCYVSFFDDSEVFGMSEFEKKEIYHNRKEKTV
jgi:uncharacterized protein YkuJ